MVRSNIEAANAVRERARKGHTVSRAMLAQILGCASSTVDNYAKAGMPEVVKGRKGVKAKVDTAQVVQWLLERERAKVIKAVRAGVSTGSAADSENGSEEDLFGVKYKDRKLAAEARLKEMDLKERSGELVEVKAVAGVVEKMIAEAKTRLRAIPTKIAPQVAVMTNENEIQASVESVIDEVLTGISGFRFGGEGEIAAELRSSQ